MRLTPENSEISPFLVWKFQVLLSFPFLSFLAAIIPSCQRSNNDADHAPPPGQRNFHNNNPNAGRRRQKTSLLQPYLRWPVSMDAGSLVRPPFQLELTAGLRVLYRCATGEGTLSVLLACVAAPRI
jgi:hypothetical protein